MSKFLGNRQLATKIKSLCFAPCQCERLIIGFPESIKLDVQEFTTNTNVVADLFQRVDTILEHPNRPFTRLSSGLNLKYAQSPIVRNAEVLVLYIINFVGKDKARDVLRVIAERFETSVVRKRGGKTIVFLTN
ncbi:hypothetical protein L3Y34_011153 [Caenorhabditis briggsae]|uniref:Uncharacterized protein n=1 Tax=Caenorhabditis briggsae TaxID=6238 RepID=A0AAE8ZL52_CAEBR|nr:hypothetical protein L3Y34_011153 [Caenorhabditis briggsae]